jgi:hypothetical protein
MPVRENGVLVNALIALIGEESNPEARRRTEAYLLALPQRELDALFVALPVLDGIVRREVLDRQKWGMS